MTSKDTFITEYFIGKDNQYGKQLGLSPEGLKNFVLEEKLILDSLIFLAKKFSKDNFSRQTLNVDMF